MNPAAAGLALYVMFSHYLRILQQSKSAILLILGSASDLSLALTFGTLQAWMTVENIDLETIGFFSLVGQVYVFKLLWLPLMDRYTPPFFGRRRGRLLTIQILPLLAIAVMGLLEPVSQLRWMVALAVVTVSCSASQDIVFDARKTDVPSTEEHGANAAISVLGYRLGMLVSGGLALWLADRYLGWRGMYWLVAAPLVSCIIATLLASEPSDVIPVPRPLEQVVAEPLCDFFGRNNTWLVLLFIILYRPGNAFATSLTTTFLIHGVGFSAGEMGMVGKTLGLFTTILGALYGGVLTQRLTLFRALLIFGALQGVSNVGYWLLSITDKHLYSMTTAVFFENPCGGMGTTAFVALLMTLCNKSFSATQFVPLSALSAVGRMYVGPIAGWLVEAHGWSTFYLFLVAVAIPGIVLLLLYRQTLEYIQHTTSFMPRSEYPQAYTLALRILVLGYLLLAVWLVLPIMNALDYTISSFLFGLLEVAALTVVDGILFGGLFDYLALRKTRLI